MGTLTPEEQAGIGEDLRRRAAPELQQFMDDLTRTVLRRIESVSVLPLHGRAAAHQTVKDAIDFIRSYDGSADVGPVIRFEVIIRYDNADRITADFGSPADAIAFLESFL